MKYDVIVIGGGIAGVTASIYLKRANKNVLLIESKVIGGAIITTPNVENYPGYESVSGATLGINLSNQVKNLNIEYKNEQVISIDGSDNNFTIKTNNSTYECKKVIIATGAKSRTLGLEDKYIGKGVSYCATCDGAFFKNKDVAVIGGGDVALDDAIYLSNICNKVYLIHRRDEFRGEQSKLNTIKDINNIEIITNATLESIQGDNLLESITINKEGNNINIDISGLFICVGRIPDMNMIELDKDDNGYIITNEELETSIKGIYAIGDIRSKSVRQLTTAASDGTISAIDIIKKI